MNRLALFASSVLYVSCLLGQVRFPYQDPNLPLEKRVSDLVSRMTLDEKVGQMLYNAPAIERLGIPAYNWWNEGLHGVARAGKATVFPQSIGLAATWDPDLLFRVATAISDEARAKYHESIRQGRRGIYEGLTFWSPNINIFRDPRWGRGMETYGEDPYLTSRLAVQFVKGLQGNDPFYLKTVATPKHYAVHSGPEPERHVFDAVVSERDLRETYLPAFEATIREAHAQSIMCAYNRFRGEPCCGSNELLQTVLREEWKFDGYVVSDCWAIQDFHATHKVSRGAPEAAALALIAGTDLNCGVAYDSLAVAVRRGLVSEAQVDNAVRRLMRARFRLGMFDPPDRVPFAGIPPEVNDSPEHRNLALEAARKSIVLLKNQGDLLPLKKDLQTIAVIGPNANDVEVLLGNYNGTPAEPVTPLEGIRRKVSAGTSVLYARGCDVAEHTPTLEVIPSRYLFTRNHENGLLAEYFNNHGFHETPVTSRVDTIVDFNWWQLAPVPGMKSDSFSVRWLGEIVPPVTGFYALGVRVFGGFRLYLDDSLLVEFSDRHVVLAQWKEVFLKAGVPRVIRVEYWDRRADASVQLVWSMPNPDLQKQALEAARRADVVVMAMGLSPRLEGEEMPVDIPGFSGGDRTDLKLPEQQENLIQEVTAIGKPVILLLLNGSALDIGWAVDHVPAIVEAWYPGQAAGSAIADVLFGDTNPSGRLPVTFYQSVRQLPPFSQYEMKGRTYRYFEGEVLYPFGYGLSYTTFQYDDLRVPAKVKAGESVRISVDVKNTGSRAGEEVVQLYVTDLKATVPVPLRSLQGMQRVYLNPGEKRTLLFDLHPVQISLIDDQFRRVLEPGRFEVSVGGKQPALHGRGESATTGVIVGEFEITGKSLILGH